MAAATALAPGRFCWCETVCRDPAGTAAFYGALLGWHHRTEDMGPAGGYTLFSRAGRDVAGGSLPPGNAEAPGHWLSYVLSGDVARDAAAAVAHGGRLAAGPVDIAGKGRFAVLLDPRGAALALWQGREPAVPWPREPGFPCWFELRTADPAAAARYYASALGWRAETRRYDRDYTVFFAGGEAVASTDAPAPGATSDHWLPYFAVTDCAAALAAAIARGAVQRVPPTEVPGLGSYAVLEDPCGAPFAIKQNL